MKGEKTLVKDELIIREQKVMIWGKINESNVCAYQELAPWIWTWRLKSESTLKGVNYVQISAGKFPFSQLCHIPAKFPLSRTKKDMFEKYSCLTQFVSKHSISSIHILANFSAYSSRNWLHIVNQWISMNISESRRIWFMLMFQMSAKGLANSIGITSIIKRS